jgi:hypothetical protein
VQRTRTRHQVRTVNHLGDDASPPWDKRPHVTLGFEGQKLAGTTRQRIARASTTTDAPYVIVGRGIPVSR